MLKYKCDKSIRAVKYKECDCHYGQNYRNLLMKELNAEKMLVFFFNTQQDDLCLFFTKKFKDYLW